MPDIAQSEVDALGAFKFLAGQYGGSPQSIAKKIDDLEKDNRDQRQEINGLKAKLPADGSVVMTQADADELALYRAIGKPAELKADVAKGEQAIKDLAARDLRDSALRFAKVAGLADETVDTLTAIPALQGAKFEVKKVKTKDDKNVEVETETAFITLPGEGQTAMTFSDAKEKVPALNGLRTAEKKDDAKGSSSSRMFVPQSTIETTAPKEGDKKQSALDAAIERNKAAAKGSNPLRPAKTL